MAYLTFQFPWNINAAEAIKAVADHFGASVSVDGTAPIVPAYIKQAVENTARDLQSNLGINNPELGVETSPAIAFGGLLNGAAGNIQATPAHVQYSADAAASPIVHAGQQDTSATTAPASLPPAPPVVNAAVAHTGSVAPTNHVAVEFDSSGLAYDERIHSGNKTKTPGGEWRTKKGTDKSLIKAIELELRAKYPNGASTVQVGESATTAVTPSTDVDAIDPNVRKQAAIDYARTQALRVAGPQTIDDSTLATIMSGRPAMVTLSPQQNDWLSIYHAKFNAAYTEYMSGNPVAGMPVASAPVAPTTPAPVALPATGNDSAVSLTPAVGTLAPAPTVPQGEHDAAGLPWDARLNVQAKIKDANGVWVQRFDVPADQKPAIIAAIRAELAGNSVGAPSSAPNGAVGSAPVVPVPPVLVSAAEASVDFTKLMQWIVANQMAGRIAATAGPDAAKSIGFADANGNGQLVLMREQAAAWPYVVQLLQAQGAV